MADKTQEIAPVAPVIGGGPTTPTTPDPSDLGGAGSAVPVTPKAKPKVTAPAAPLGRLETFLRPSKTPINRAAYDATKLADIDENLRNNYIKSDAVKDIDSRYALHTLITGGPPDKENVPGAKYKVDIDTEAMRRNILDSKFNLSADDQIRYGRALQIFDTMAANKFSVMKGPGGAYWLESEENGKRVYASNGILEVAELVDKFNGTVDPATGKTVPEKKIETNPKKLAKLITNDPNQELFTESEKWHMAALGTDLVTSLAGVAGKLTTAGTGGAGFMAGAVGLGASITGGLAALGMSMRGDWLDADVSTGEMFKNAGVRLGLEAMETVTVLPVSVMSSLKGASKAGKILRKGIHLFMLKGVLDTATGTDWEKTMDKETWEMDDYRKMAAMAQFLVGSVGGAAANRYGTRKGITAATNEANVPLDKFTAARKPAVQAEGLLKVKAKDSELGTLLQKRKAKIQEKADTATQSIDAAAKTQKVVLRQRKAAEVKQTIAAKAAAEKAPVNKDANGQVNIDFDAPAPTPINSLKAVQAKYKKENSALNKQIAAEKAKVNTVTSEAMAKADAVRTEASKRAFIRQMRTDNKQIGAEHVANTTAANAKLEGIVAQANKEHGSIIAGKLRSRGEKKSTASVEALANQKAANKKAEVEVESKLDGYAKEKAALEKKMVGVEESKRAPEDVAEMKRIEDAIVKETKNSKGLRGAGRKLVANVKKGTTATGKKVSSIASILNTVPSSLTVRDNVSSKALARATIYGEGVDDLTGNRFYEYDMPTAKARLIEEGYSEEEIKKYSLGQLREALHKIEQREQDEKTPGLKLVENKKRPKVRKHQMGGMMTYSGIQNFAAPAPVATTVYSPNYLNNILSYAATGKPSKLTMWNSTVGPDGKRVPYVVKTAGPQKSKGDAIDAIVETVKSKGHLTDAEIDDAEAQKKKAVEEAAEENKKAVEAKYDAIIAAAKKVPVDTSGKAMYQLATLFSEFKASDLFGKNTIHIETPIAENVRASVLHSRGVRNMPGFHEAINRTTIQPRVDTADSFAANMMQKSYQADGERRRGELVARNASFVENSRAEDLAIKNRNIEAENNADNANIQRRNQAEAVYASQLAQAKAQKETLDNQRKGRLANAFSSGLSKVYVGNRQEALTLKFNEAAATKSKWNNEYKPRYDAAVAAGDATKVKQVKSEFIEKNLYDPDDLDKQMMDIKAQFRNLGS